jgi:hypothetical protein
MFGKNNLSLYVFKDYLISSMRSKNVIIEHESSKICELSFNLDDRRINIRLTLTKSGIIFDIIDPYGFLRIPKCKFKDFNKFREFFINVFSKRINL